MEALVLLLVGVDNLTGFILQGEHNCVSSRISIQGYINHVHQVEDTKCYIFFVCWDFKPCCCKQTIISGKHIYILSQNGIQDSMKKDKAIPISNSDQVLLYSLHLHNSSSLPCLQHSLYCCIQGTLQPSLGPYRSWQYFYHLTHQKQLRKVATVYMCHHFHT